MRRCGKLRTGSSYYLAACLVVVGVLAALAVPAYAQTSGTWTAALSGNWSNTANWDGGILADGVGQTGDFSTIDLASNINVTVDGATRTLGILNIGDINKTNSYTINASSGTLLFDNGASNAQINQSINSNGDTISAPVKLNGSLDINNQSTSNKTFTLSGAISAATTGTLVISNTGTGTSVTALSGAITDGTGIVAVREASTTSPLQLKATNTFTGGVTLNSGTLQIDNTNVLGNGPLTINGGFLQATQMGVPLNTVTPIVINNDFSLISTNTLYLGNGAVSLGTSAGTTRTITVATSTVALTLGGAISNGVSANSLTKAGPGLLYLAGSNTYTGNTNITGGILLLDYVGGLTPGSIELGNATVAAHMPINQTFLNAIDLTTNPTGTVALATNSNNNLDFSGGTSPITMFLGSIGNYTYGGTITPAFDGIYRVGGGGGVLTLTAPNGLVATNSLIVGGNVILSATNSVNGTTTISNNSTLQLGTGISGFNGSVASASIVDNSGSTLMFKNADAQTYSGVISGGGALTKTGSNSLNLTGSNTYTGATNINGGAIVLSGPNGSINGSASTMTFSGGTLQMVNATTETAVDRVRNGTGITSNGGAIVYTNAAGSGLAYTETIGSVSLSTGQLNVVLSNDLTSGGNTQALTLTGLSQGGTSRGTVTFSAPAGTGPDSAVNMIKRSGAGQTAAGAIIAPWATVGTSPTAQTDYAVYDASTNIVPANIAASDPPTWLTPTNAYTLDDSASLTIDSQTTIAAMRYSGTGNTLTLNAPLQTSGILNAGSGTLTIAGTSPLQQPGTSAANLYLTAGANDIVVNAPITNNVGNLTLVKAGAGTVTLAGPTARSPAAPLRLKREGSRWPLVAPAQAAGKSTTAPRSNRPCRPAASWAPSPM